jgi:site-specific DNA-methyltransferase (adenine-specific)
MDEQLNITETKSNQNNIASRFDCQVMLPYYDKDGITIYNGDAEQVMIALRPNGVIITDPPYLYLDKGLRNNDTSLFKGKHTNNKNISASVMELGDFDSKQVRQFLELAGSLTDTIIIFCNEVLVRDYLACAEDLVMNYNLMVWQKPTKILNRNRYSADVEYIIRFYRKGLQRHPENKYYSKVKRYNLTGNVYHPTEKPIDLMADLLAVNTTKDDLVIDPFMGSGTTLLAAKKLGRKAVGIELSQEYCDVAIKRLNQMELF